MKKIIILAFLIAVLSGCGTNDRLTCTKENTIASVTSSTKYVIDYRNNNIKKIDLTYEYKDTKKDKANDEVLGGVVGEALDDVIDTVKDGIIDISGIKTTHKDKYNTYTNIDGFTSNVNMDTDDTYKITYSYDLSKLSDADITSLDITRDFNTFKEKLTNRGLTCK